MIGAVLKLPDTPASRARLKWLEAHAAAAEHTEQMIEALETGARFCAEVADGGEAYPVGVRAYARVEAERLRQGAASLRAIVSRSSR